MNLSWQQHEVAAYEEVLLIKSMWSSGFHDRERMLPCIMSIWGENVSHSRHMLWQVGKISAEFVSVKCGFRQEFFSHVVGMQLGLWWNVTNGCNSFLALHTHTLQRRLTICSCLDVHQQSYPCDSVPQHFQNSHSPFLKFFCDHIWLVFFGRPNFLLNITNMSNIIWHPTII